MRDEGSGVVVATVDRVLPWRRQTAAPADEVAPVVAAYRSRHPKASTTTITRAYEVAATAHAEQFRKSGERYINHPVAVARIVAELGLDETTVSAALLHDAVEDTSSSASASTPKRSSRPPRCARCSWRWPRTCGS